jgi:hypothetical protein
MPGTDIEIARHADKRPIQEIGARLGIPTEALIPYGHDKAKVAQAFIAGLADRPDGKLVLVTAINPTPAGEGKTTTTVGLGDALNHIGKKAVICLREPSLGPVFGVKGGAAGGGYAQVVLALKVVLAQVGSTPCLVFDEVDSGIGGATADAVGERLARIGASAQVLVVTHAPQVAARADHHGRVEKNLRRGRATVAVKALAADERREEITRMLAGAKVTEAARAAAASLIAESA